MLMCTRLVRDFSRHSAAIASGACLLQRQHVPQLVRGEMAHMHLAQARHPGFQAASGLESQVSISEHKRRQDRLASTCIPGPNLPFAIVAHMFQQEALAIVSATSASSASRS